MAFGYKIPNFNVWGRCWKPVAIGPDPGDVSWTFLGYFRCQLKAFGTHNTTVFTLEVPKWTAFKPRNQTVLRLGYRVQLAGWESQWATVFYVDDVGAGFPNEHRSVFCERPADDSWDGVEGFYLPAIDTALQPPPGFEMMATTPPTDYWEEPNMGDVWDTP